MHSARETMLPLNSNSKFKKLLYLLKKHDIKIATIFIAALCLIFSILFWVVFPARLLHLLPVRFIPFTVITLFVGIYKKKPWMFFPFLWYLGAMIVLNIVSYGLTVNAVYDYVKEYSYLSGRIYDSFDWALFFNVIAIPLYFCFYLITHRCNKMFVEKAKYEYDGNNDYRPEVQTTPKWLFGYSVKNGTVIICVFSILCCICIEIWAFITYNYEINFNSIFPLLFIAFAVAATIFGVWKQKSWLFLPFIWVVETLVFLSFTLFINSICVTIKGENYRYYYERYMMMNHIYPFKYWIKLMFFESVLQTYIPNIFLLKVICFLICIIAMTLSIWIFLIIHNCYMLICEKNRAQKLAHQRVSLEEN